MQRVRDRQNLTNYHHVVLLDNNGSNWSHVCGLRVKLLNNDTDIDAK
jgi:hypothetical protein